jgi:hypothetical protein
MLRRKHLRILLIPQLMVWNIKILCPIPFIEDTPEVRKKTKRVYITVGRIQRLGPTPGCRACLAFTPNHTPECVARHEEAHGHASPVPTPRAQGELEELQDEVFPPGLDIEYEPSIASHDPSRRCSRRG